MSLMPLAMAFVLMPSYFSVNAYNWWYVILLPATFALVPAMVHRRDERKLDYRAIFPLHVDLKKSMVIEGSCSFGVCAIRRGHSRGGCRNPTIFSG